MLIIDKCIKPYTDTTGMSYACGQCYSCRKTKALEWSIRGRHELMFHKKASFITLTYNYKNLVKAENYEKINKSDKGGTLVKEHFPLFMKRLRKRYKDIKIRFVQCGEYGTIKIRPHHHAILYGIGLEDIIYYDEEYTKKIIKKSAIKHILNEDKSRFYEYPDKKNLAELVLKSIWKMGHVDISDEEVTDNAIQYVIGYIRKKITDKEKANRIFKNRIRPYMTTSQGIGRDYVDKYSNEIAETMKINYRKMTVGVPRYYIKRIKKNEGRTIKHKVTTYKNNEITERTEYKILCNLNGKNTKKIIEHETNPNTRIKDIREKLKDKTNNRNINKICKHVINITTKKRLKYEKEYKYYYNKSDKELSKQFEKHILERKESTNPNINENIIEKTNRSLCKKLQSSAKNRNKIIEGGVFGKREKYEILEEFHKTNENT